MSNRPKNVMESFYRALSEGYKNYFTAGARSHAKLIPIHGWFHQQIESWAAEHTEQKLEVESLHEGGREAKVEGIYNPKKVDVAVFKRGDDAKKPILIISLKFAITSLKKNVNNYFEHLIGETTNLRGNGVAVAAFSVLPVECPRLNSNNEVLGTDTLVDRDLMKYKKLFADSGEKNQWGNPDALGIELVDLSGEGNSAEVKPPGEGAFPINGRGETISAEMSEFIKEELAIEPFMDGVFKTLNDRLDSS